MEPFRNVWVAFGLVAFACLASASGGECPFGAPRTPLGDSVYENSLLADVDGDGIPDAIGIDNSRELRAFLGGPDGRHRLAWSRRLSTSASLVATGDLTGDDVVDLVVLRDTEPKSIALWSGNGDGTFVETAGWIL